MDRKGSAVWEGTIREGKGSVSTESGVLAATPYSFTSRFEHGAGTNPEELLGAAHAGCFTMAVCAALTRAGLKPTRLSTQAAVILEQVEGAWTLTASHLEMRAVVPGITAERFAEVTADAKVNCPVSRALNLKITLDAQLEATR